MKQKRNVHLNFANVRKKYSRMTARKQTFFFCIILMLFTSQLSLAGNVRHDNKEIEKYSHPKDSIIDGCINASCLQIKDNMRICNCLKDKETYTGSFILYQGQVQKNQWWTGCNYGTSYFEVLESDMDGSGKKEIIVANFNGQSNGMGVTYWTLSIIDPRNYGKPLTFGVEDYGDGSIYWDEKEKRCNILATNWEWLKDPKLGDGLYFIGRFFRYKSGILEPIADRKIRARRYLFSFQNERGSTFSQNEDMDMGAPLQWLTNAKTEILRLDPVLDTFKGSSTNEGMIKEVILDRDGKNLKISVLLNKEKMSNYIYPGIDDSNFKDIIDRFVDYKSGMSYPDAYLPIDPKLWLVGKKVDIFSRYDATREETHYLFLLKN
jgi:hypothetical protein